MDWLWLIPGFGVVGLIVYFARRLQHFGKIEAENEELKDDVEEAKAVLDDVQKGNLAAADSSFDDELRKRYGIHS